MQSWSHEDLLLLFSPTQNILESHQHSMFLGPTLAGLAYCAICLRVLQVWLLRICVKRFESEVSFYQLLVLICRQLLLCSKIFFHFLQGGICILYNTAATNTLISLTPPTLKISSATPSDRLGYFSHPRVLSFYIQKRATWKPFCCMGAGVIPIWFGSFNISCFYCFFLTTCKCSQSPYF